jgi:8-oxo-dGTP diphosphatase
MVSLLLIAKNKKFLLLKRSENENNYSGYWGLPGGGVEKNETPTDAIIREVMEETGLDITNMRLLNKYPHYNTFINLFVFNSKDFDESNIELNDEHSDWGMFSYYEILKMKNIIPTTVTFIGEYLKNEGF